MYENTFRYIQNLGYGCFPLRLNSIECAPNTSSVLESWKKVACIRGRCTEAAGSRMC